TAFPVEPDLGRITNVIQIMIEEFPAARHFSFHAGALSKRHWQGDDKVPKGKIWASFTEQPSALQIADSTIGLVGTIDVDRNTRALRFEYIGDSLHIFPHPKNQECH